MKSAAPPGPLAPKHDTNAHAGNRLEAALERQRQQMELELTLYSHEGTLDIERLAARLPDAREPVGRSLVRVLRQDGRYVKLRRGLGTPPAAQVWHGRQEQKGRLEPNNLSPRLWAPLAWLEELAGIRLPTVKRRVQDVSLAVGESALLLPWSAATSVTGTVASGASTQSGLLLAERQGQLYQLLSDARSEGRWQLLEYAGALQTGPQAQVDAAVLGLEPLPDSWRLLSSARRQERANRVHLLSLAGLVLLLALVGSFVAHTGLYLLLMPGVIAALVLLVLAEKKLSGWIDWGPALGHLKLGHLKLGHSKLGHAKPGEWTDSSAVPTTPQSALPPPSGYSSEQAERLLSPDTRSLLAKLRDELSVVAEQAGPELVAPFQAELKARLEDRFSYLSPDAALDALLEGQVQALSKRLKTRLQLERERARQRAETRLLQEPVDPHF